MLGAITDIDFAAENSVDFVPNDDQPAVTLEEALKRDPVATTRSLIRGVSFSLHQRQCTVLTLSRFARHLSDGSTFQRFSRL